jgi:hypothetical protein
MMMIVRIATGLVGLGALALVVNSGVKVAHDPLATMIQTLLLTAALFLLWFAVLGNRPSERNKLARTLMIGVVTGAVAFALGFFGPLVFFSSSNQGPLLGIFITGPAGFVLGSIAGFVWTRFVPGRVKQ